ncbi:MAG: hypothetical protein IJR02_06105 [Bacteroidaceae bacterium]|nr:hypothetical protein [Bacteroidaceae bacterium]
MKRLFTLLLIACSTIAVIHAQSAASRQKRPEKVIATLNAIIDHFGEKEGLSFSINRNPNTNIIESSEKISAFSCHTTDASFEAIASSFMADEPLCYQILHITPGSKQHFALKMPTSDMLKNNYLNIRTKESQEMWYMATKNPENPQLRDVYAIAWERGDFKSGKDVEGTVFMITSLRPDIYEKELASSKKTFKIVGRVDENIKDSLYNIYIAESAAELEAIGDDDYVACVPVINKRFEWQTELDKPMAGRLRCIFPDGSLCSAWINLDFVPGETYNITVHNGYYDGDQDYERRVGRYSGRSLLNERQKRGNDDVVILDDVVIDTIPTDHRAIPLKDEIKPTPEQEMRIEAQSTALKGNMDAIKATYSSLEPFVKMRSLTGSDNYFKQIIKLNKELDVKFQDYIKYLKGIYDDALPPIWKKGLYEGILKFYSEQSQAYGELYKNVGVLPKPAKDAQRQVNQLMEKYMKEMGKVMTEH